MALREAGMMPMNLAQGVQDLYRDLFVYCLMSMPAIYVQPVFDVAIFWNRPEKEDWDIGM